jgi:hypothetical protein
MSSQSQNPFTWRHFQADIILLCSSSYREKCSSDFSTPLRREKIHLLPLFYLLATMLQLYITILPLVSSRYVLGLHLG